VFAGFVIVPQGSDFAYAVAVQRWNQGRGDEGIGDPFADMALISIKSVYVIP
jgi:hypothetical protein